MLYNHVPALIKKIYDKGILTVIIHADFSALGCDLKEI